MHEARHGVFELGLDRDDVALRAGGYDGVLQRLGVGGRRDDLLQRVAHPGRGGADEPPYRGQLRARGVSQLVLAGDGARYLVLKEAVRDEGVEKAVNTGLFVAPAVAGGVAARLARSAEHASDVH